MVLLSKRTLNKEVGMRTHPQEGTSTLLKERVSEQASFMKQRVADSTFPVQSKLPRHTWSIKVPRVYCHGIEFTHGVFEHVMFIVGTEARAKKVARIITGLQEEAEERPNWKVCKGVGEEYVIDAKKFLSNSRASNK